jgi:hypothetical protein
VPVWGTHAVRDRARYRAPTTHSSAAITSGGTSALAAIHAITPLLRGLLDRRSNPQACRPLSRSVPGCAASCAVRTTATAGHDTSVIPGQEIHFPERLMVPFARDT